MTTTTYEIGWLVTIIGGLWFGWNSLRILWSAVKKLILPFIVVIVGLILKKGAWVIG